MPSVESVVSPRPSVSAVEKHLAALRACDLCPLMHKPVVVGRPVASRVLLVGHMDTVFGVDHPFQTPDWIDERTVRGPGVSMAARSEPGPSAASVVTRRMAPPAPPRV